MRAGAVTAWRRALGVAAGAALAVGVAVMAPSAASADTPATCSNLQSVLNAASSGDVITLDGLCSGTTFTLPAVAITLQGAPGTTSGFDGTGLSGSTALLSGTVNSGATETISSLVFENNSVSGTPIFGAGLSLTVTGLGGVTLTDDTFTGDIAEGGGVAYGGGLYLSDNDSYAGTAVTPGAFTITGSTFTGDGATTTGSGGTASGGGATVLVNSLHDLDVNPRPVTLTGDTFAGDTVDSATVDAGLPQVGAGLFVDIDGVGASPLMQSHDTFTANTITASVSPLAQYGGGGEWTQGFDVTSTGDLFTSNTIPGSNGTGQPSWGAGLGILNNDCQTPGFQTQSTGVDLVAAGNTISGGMAAQSNGAGIYVGCGSVAPGNQLTLIDSTVTANSATAGGIAGIAGGNTDTLNLENTIDTDNVGGADLGDFATVTADHSDACVLGNPLSGNGDVCAAPVLVGGTNVAETAGSPTIDAGSNAGVPSGLSVDAFGNPRIDPGGTATVDIGAAEYVHPGPLASTGAASAVTAKGAVLTGTVDPRGTPTTYVFQYGTSTAYGLASPSGGAGSGVGAGGVSATLSGLAPATTYDYRIVATSPSGTADGANQTFTTPGVVGITPPPVGGPVVPVISLLGESARTWRVGVRHSEGGPPTGTTFHFTLNAAATVRLRFTRGVGGRRVDGRCVAADRRNAKRPHCVRTVTVGTITVAGVAGTNTRAFSGIFNGHRLPPGAYTLHIRATTSGGLTSATKTIHFTIVRVKILS